MGDAADHDFDQNLDALIRHTAGRCGEFGPCPYCEDEPMPDETDFQAQPGLYEPSAHHTQAAPGETVLPSGEVVAAPAAVVPVARATRALITREAIAEEREQREILAAYVREQMVPDVDFGVIPGTQKPTLLKPGAEKLTELFRCTAEFELTHKVEDWDKPLFHYAFTCRIRHRASGTVVAEGVGSCNTMEDRYRYRNAKRKCPVCGKETVIKGRAEFGGGWLCWKKEGKSDGCGAKWPEGAKEIEDQIAGKVENEDVYTQVNTVLKMAKKRAHVDAGIALGRVSDIFTQDMEDNPQEQPASGGKPVREAAQGPPAGPPPGSVTKNQANTLNALVESVRAGGDVGVRDQFCRAWQIPDVAHLPAEKFAKAQEQLAARFQKLARQGAAT